MTLQEELEAEAKNILLLPHSWEIGFEINIIIYLIGFFSNRFSNINKVAIELFRNFT